MKAIAVLILLAALTGAGFAQSGAMPPLGKDAFLNPGKVVTAYDEFTDKSKIELLIPLRGDLKQGVFMMPVCVYSGRKPAEPLATNLAILVVSAKATREDEPLLLLIDGQRVELPVRYVANQAEGAKPAFEFFIIPVTFTAKQIRELSDAKQFKGRIGGYLEFEVGAPARALLAEFARKMDTHK
jgi:hypothetical protein